MSLSAIDLKVFGPDVLLRQLGLALGVRYSGSAIDSFCEGTGVLARS